MLGLISALQRRFRRIAAIEELRRLPPHTLDDLGIAPEQIPDIVAALIAREEGSAEARPESRRPAPEHSARTRPHPARARLC